MDQNESIVPESPQGPKDVTSRLLGVHLSVPQAAQACSGIKLLGRTVRSLVFSTDLVVIRNCDADAVLAVYPFTCQPAITQALVSTAGRPVLTGVAGSTTSGARSVLLAMESETQGVSGVVLNYGATADLVSSIAQVVDVPVVATITDWDDLAREKVSAGALVLNIAGGARTPSIVEAVRNELPYMPIIATAGPTEESAWATVKAGADAISWTPPSLQQIEKELMARAREQEVQD